MNTRQPIDQSTGPVSLSAAFNQDNSCFSVGLNTGFCVFDSAPCELRMSNDFDAGIGIVEMLGRANYVALVGGGKQPKFPPNKVIIWDDNKSRAAFTLEFNSLVLRVRLSRSRIVVALNNSVHIYAFSAPPERLAVYETADNPLGLCCLGSKYIVFPGPSPGQVKIVEIESRNVGIVPAHSSPLRAMTLSQDGQVLATASETGTLIRIFSTANCARIAELRRGMETARIFSLAISPSSTLLAVTSDKATLHIFDLPHHYIQTQSAGATGHLRNHLNSRSASPASHSSAVTGVNASSTAGSSSDGYENRSWGLLSKIPLLPRAFSDVYSFATARFEMGDEPMTGPGVAAPTLAPSLRSNSSTSAAITGIAAGGGLPAKGVIGWLGDDKLVLVGAGRDGRWEKFLLNTMADGRRVLMREGWKRYLGAY